MEGMTDWNKLTMEQYIEHLEEKFKFDSSGTAKAVFELINAYKALTINNVVVPKGTLLIKDLEDWHIKRWNNGLETGASMDEIREDMEIASKSNDLHNSIKWLEK